jgi:hypothetical protein
MDRGRRVAHSQEGHHFIVLVAAPHSGSQAEAYLQAWHSGTATHLAFSPARAVPTGGPGTYDTPMLPALISAHFERVVLRGIRGYATSFA